MQKLLTYIASKKHWFLFILCEIISIILIYRNNDYQRQQMLNSANAISGAVSAATYPAVAFINLRKTNNELLERNNWLEMEVIRLQEQLRDKATDTTSFRQVLPGSVESQELRALTLTTVDSLRSETYTYKYIPASVINNSVAYMSNYITINKGSNDGIRPDMGIVSPRGVAGVVKTVNDHYSVAISLLNVNWKLSCKVKNSQYFGGLSWKGDDEKFAYLEELPSHTTFQVGDTIVTSGYSTIFPSGLVVGTIESYKKQRDDNFYSLKVRLITNFHALDVVSVIDNARQEEQESIEKEAKKND